jgi:PKD repeat protein
LNTSIVSWSWTFSDGAAAQGAVVSHAFQTPGQHSATLRVVDDDGATDSDVTSVQVSNRPPVAVAGPDRSAVTGSSVSFDGSGSYDLDGEITAWVWDFGDGSSAGGVSPTHGYQQAGTFTVTLGVSDDAGGVAFDTATVTVSSPAGGADWAKRLGGIGSDAVKAVAVDAAGNVAVAGIFMNSIVVDGTTLTSAGSTDAFVAKYSPTGAVLWLNAFGGADPDTAESVAFDPAGNVVVVGSFSRSVSFGGPTLTSRGGSDIFVVKYGPTGAHLWSRSYGDTLNDTAYGVAVDGSGNPVLTGYFTGTVNFGAGTCSVPFTTDTDVYLLKMNGSGTPTWVRCFFNTAAEFGYAVATDAAGAVYLTGTFNGRINLGGSEFDSAGIMEDVFLGKFSAAGTHLWSRQAGDDENDQGRGLATDGAGNVYVVGSFRGAANFGGTTLQSSGGSADVFLAKYGSTGSHLWSRRVGGTDDDEGLGLTLDASGEPIVTGFFRGTMDAGGGPLVSRGLRDIFLARFSTAGAHRASTSWGGTGDDRGLGVAATPSGRVATGGTFKDTATFGGPTLTSAGGADACMVQRNL